tara:strand:- start:230 stop:430 length:201 start_codon:yes stop_codon:yes gene_type:complete
MTNMTPVIIKVSASITINLGNYESAKIEAGMEMPVPQGHTTEMAYKSAWRTVEAELNKKAQEIRKK